MATVKPVMNGKAVETAMAAKSTGAGSGLVFERYFTDGKVSPFDKMEWERRTALIGNEKGVTIFKQEGVEVPKSWSQTATNIVTSKYFHGKPGTAEREVSVRQLIGRVVNTIVRWGEEGDYFADAASRDSADAKYPPFSPQPTIVFTTRPISCRTDVSRSGVSIFP